jgi:hypothetical protein
MIAEGNIYLSCTSVHSLWNFSSTETDIFSSQRPSQLGNFSRTT